MEFKKDDWGVVDIRKVEDGDLLETLISELCDDDSNFINNLRIIFDDFKKGNLYTLKVCETKSMFNRKAYNDEIFAGNKNIIIKTKEKTFNLLSSKSNYILPCLCCRNRKTVDIIWVHSRCRRNGFGTKLIELLNLNKIYSFVEGSEEFWNSFNVKDIRKRKCFPVNFR